MKNKLIKILIPFVAVLVIFESIMLVSTLKKDKKTTTNSTGDVVATVTLKETGDSVIDLSFKSDVSELKVGKSYKVVLNLTPKQGINLDVIDLYVKFDPSLLTISNLITSSKLKKPDFIKVSDKKDVIVTNFLFADKDGVSFDTKGVDVLTFNVTPKKTGSAFLEINKGDNDGSSVTMFVDKTTGKELPFSSDKLEFKLVN